jgi:hypothetical protein
MIRRLRCLIGRHAWAQQRNPESAGPEAIYFICRHCGREKPGYGPPIADSIG